MNLVTQFTNWEFLNEPAYRWFLAIGAFFGMLWAWNGILDFMK